jgi:hypothetical protein
MGTGIGYSFIGACALAFLTIAHTRAMKMKEHYRFAAEYFWYSGGLLPLAGACVFLASTGDLPVNPQRALLFAVGALAGGSFLLGLGEWVRPTAVNAQTPQMTSNESAPQVNISGGDNVVSIGQIGGITARVVTINPPMRPELRILEKSEIDNSDGSRTVIIKTEVASPITPGSLIIGVRADGILNVQIFPGSVNGTSTIDMRNVIRGTESFSAEIPSPRGQYAIVVQTNKPTNIQLDASF